MSTASQLARALKARQRLYRRLFTAAVVLLFAGLFAARPLGRWWKQRETALHLQEGSAAIQRQDWPCAIESVSAAAKLRPGDPQVLRAMVAIMKGTGENPNTILRTLDQLRQTGGLISEDLPDIAEAQLNRGDLSGVQTTLNSLPPAIRKSARVLQIESGLLVLLDRVPQAVDVLRHSRASHPEDEDIRFRLAVLHLKHGTTTERREAQDHLWEEARRDSSRTGACLQILLESDGLTFLQIEELQKRASELESDASLSLKYLATARLLQLRPVDRPEILAGLTRASLDQRPTEQLAFLRFLAALQESQRMLDWLSSHGAGLRASQPAETVNLELEALAQEHQWPRARTLLASPTAQCLDPVTHALWQACVVSAQSGTHDAVEEHLQRALKASHGGSHQAKALRLADTAERLGMLSTAAESYELLATAAPMPGDTLLFLEQALRMRTQLREGEAAAEIAQRIATLTPDHAANDFRATYLALLTGAALEPITSRLANPAVEATDPSAEQQQKLLWCMIYDRRKQSDVLKKEVEGLDLAWPWSAGMRAVIAGLLAEVGRHSPAEDLASKIPRALLLAEELAYLERLARAPEDPPKQRQGGLPHGSYGG